MPGGKKSSERTKRKQVCVAGGISTKGEPFTLPFIGTLKVETAIADLFLKDKCKYIIKHRINTFIGL